MKNKTTFTNEGWGFTTVWHIADGISYPCLKTFYQKPVIIGDDKLITQENVPYNVTYKVKTSELPGANNLATFSLKTNAKWLTITQNGLLFGLPYDNDVGIYWVNVSVYDLSMCLDYHNFTLSVEKDNESPLLFNGNLTPNNGNIFTNFTFSTWYKDNDIDVPVNISVVIDNIWYSMTLEKSESLDFKSGVKYYFIINLTDGAHEYYFFASDGKIGYRLPQYKTFKTPYIIFKPENNTHEKDPAQAEIDTDNDGYNDTFENLSGSDPYNLRSTPLDFDGDGWNNTIEIPVGTDPRDSLSTPPDMDKDGIADALDSDRDGDGSANWDDAFPDDGQRWEDEVVNTEGNNVIIWIVILVVMVVLVAGIVIGIVLIRRRMKYKGNEHSKMVEQSLEDEFGRVSKSEESDGE